MLLLILDNFWILNCKLAQNFLVIKLKLQNHSVVLDYLMLLPLQYITINNLPKVSCNLISHSDLSGKLSCVLMTRISGMNSKFSDSKNSPMCLGGALPFMFQVPTNRVKVFLGKLFSNSWLPVLDLYWIYRVIFCNYRFYGFSEYLF